MQGDNEATKTLAALVRQYGAEFLEREQAVMLADVIAGMSDGELFEGTRLRISIYGHRRRQARTQTGVHRDNGGHGRCPRHAGGGFHRTRAPGRRPGWL